MNYITASASERIKRWPFLQFRRAKPDEDFCWDDCLETGWRIAFGEMMWDEIAAELNKNDEINCFFIDDIKEKWGALYLYFSCIGRSADKVDHIIQKYSTLSRHICIGCGRPDVPFSTGWIIPECKDCYSKTLLTKDWTKEHVDESYQKTFSKESRMSDWLHLIINAPNKPEVDRKWWIKETADKIRENWEKTHEEKP